MAHQILGSPETYRGAPKSLRPSPSRVATMAPGASQSVQPSTAHSGARLVQLKHNQTGSRIKLLLAEAEELIRDTSGRWSFVSLRRTAVKNEITKYKDTVDTWLKDPGVPLPWSHTKRGLCNITGQFKPTKLFEFLFVWTSLIMRAFSTFPAMANSLIAFQLWFSKIGFQMSLTWE
jgi:hypothetical protein